MFKLTEAVGVCVRRGGGGGWGEVIAVSLPVFWLALFTVAFQATDVRYQTMSFVSTPSVGSHLG